MHAYFLNVGQGDAILIRTPNGKNILIDGGPDRKILAELKEVMPFFDNTVDYMMFTHPDKDHFEGLIHVLKKYPVKQILFTGVYKNNYLSNAFFKAAREKNIKITVVDEKSDISLADGTTIDIVFPFHQTLAAQKATNNSSLIINIIYGNNKILLTGDSEIDTEEKLLAASSKIDADILKVGHHGSKTSSSMDFLKVVTPKYSVIEVGKDNQYRHPHQSTLENLKKMGSKIFRTDLDGRIEFIMSKTGIIKIKTNP